MKLNALARVTCSDCDAKWRRTEQWRSVLLWLIVVVLLVLALGGGGWGYRSGYYGGPAFGGGVGLIVLIVILVLIFGGGGIGWR